MIDKEAFDRQINSIRTRYNRLCNAKASQIPNVASFDPQDCRKVYEDKNIFITPIKANKNQGLEQSISFSKLPEVSNEAKTIDIQALAAQYQKRRKQSCPRYGLKENILTSRELSQRKKQSKQANMNKQQLLLKRVKQNQKLLKMSQELRQGQTKSKSTTKPSKQQNNKEEELYNYRSKPSEQIDKITKRNMQLKLDLQNISKEGYYDKKVMSDRFAKNKRGGEPLRNIKNDICKQYTQARSTFNNKMNQILQNFKSKTPHKEEVIIPKATKVEQIQQFTYRSQNKETNKQIQQLFPKQAKLELYQKQNTKVVSVFENTSKIEERIKAILFCS